MQLFSADPTKINLCSPKVAKLKSTIVFLLPAQPKWSKQNNLCSKMWPTEQLYIELGCGRCNVLKRF